MKQENAVADAHSPEPDRNMLTRILRSAFTSDLRVLRREIEAYPDERDLWKLLPGIANPAGALARHQAGTILYMIGTVLGDTGYVRDRDNEFAGRDVPRAQILADIDQAIETVRQVLDRLTDEDLEREYPIDVGAGQPVTTGTFLVRLAMHTSYHNGQINYHRRLLTTDETAGATTGA
jgi:hypothetical protein